MPTGGKATLTQFLIEERRRAPQATGDLNALITDVSLACKAISRKVALGSLGGMLGEAGSSNVQDEQQKTLDVVSNQIFLRANEWGGYVAGMVSEEMEEVYTLPPQYPRAAVCSCIRAIRRNRPGRAACGCCTRPIRLRFSSSRRAGRPAPDTGG